jgi:hypothetical protein
LAQLHDDGGLAGGSGFEDRQAAIDAHVAAEPEENRCVPD